MKFVAVAAFCSTFL